MSDRDFMILGKLILTFGCLLGWPIWELWKLKRSEPPPASVESEGETGTESAQITDEPRA